MSARIATERVYRTLDGRYVPHGHEDAAFLVVGVGGPMPADFPGFDATAAIVADDEPEVADDEPDDQADEPEVADEPVAPKKPPAKTKKA